MMNAHKFAVGQTVTFATRGQSRTAHRDSVKIVRLLPAEANDYQYRVKSTRDGHERVVKESQLSS
jgi:hypothetical protein